MERENLAGDGKEKAQAATTARPKVPMHRRGAHCPVVVIEPRNDTPVKSKGAGHHRYWANRVKLEEAQNVSEEGGSLRAVGTGAG